MNYTYTRFPARYAKRIVAIQCPSTDGWKSNAASVLESVAPRSIRWSGRERAYIVSNRVADKFEAEILRRQTL
jgi:hypothetical protein